MANRKIAPLNRMQTHFAQRLTLSTTRVKRGSIMNHHREERTEGAKMTPLLTR